MKLKCKRIVQHKRRCNLVTLKDIFYVFEGPELSDGFPGIAHHVADDLLLDGVTLLTHFQLCLVLEEDRTPSTIVNQTMQFCF